MGKSSRKNKRSKHSSQVKKKSRKSKSKKLRHRYDSDSGFSSEESESSSHESDSSPSSGQDYRRRRGKRGLRKSRKRTRRQSPSSASSESEDSVPVKKRKRLKRKEDSSSRRKAYKKKSRRSPSVSSRSLSCSTCSQSSGSDKSDFERSRGRSRRRDKGKRDPEKSRSRIGRHRGRDRSRLDSLPGLSGDTDMPRNDSSPSLSQGRDRPSHDSLSSISRGRDRSRQDSSPNVSRGRDWPRRDSSPSLTQYSSGHRSEERSIDRSYSRRLRSVITIAGDEENVELGKEGFKEEIMYDHDDYPPCRSNDSIDGGSKKELAIDLLSETPHEENGEMTNYKLGGVEDIYGHDNGNVTGKSKERDQYNTGADVDDLETILRQRALENLLKFRGGHKNNNNISSEKNERSDGTIRHSSPKGSDFIDNESPKAESARVVGLPMPLLERDDVVPPPNDEKPKSESDGGKNSCSGMQEPPCTLDQGTNRTSENVNIRASSAINNPKSATVSHSGVTLRSCISSEQAHASEIVLQENIVATVSASNINVSDAAKNASGSIVNDVEEVQNASKSVDQESSPVEPPSRDPHQNELQDQAKESSQYEQKTMSVMRGGEMVQVSYKVYIPKKTPALARRKLKR